MTNLEARTQGVKLTSEDINVDFIPESERILAELWFSGLNVSRKKTK